MLYNTKWAESKIKEPSLTYPSMAGLVHLLRNKELWPKGYKWEHFYGAQNLAVTYWPGSVGQRERNQDVSQMLAMGLKDNWDETYSRIFYAREGYRPANAEVVADRLEAFLNKDSNREAYQALMSLRLGC